MRAAVIVEADPVADDACRVLDAFEAVLMNTLLLEGANDALDHAVLLRAVRGDELLLQSVAADDCRAVTADAFRAVARWEEALF